MHAQPVSLTGTRIVQDIFHGYLHPEDVLSNFLQSTAVHAAILLLVTIGTQLQARVSLHCVRA